eukprot:CAMPEP_0175029470 /NCGR_PEP_ID=MMETSP0005-20121125/19623_1 /TAXON_ID=420556 /ORGANISM="Ochromonas sp., Strain CCMP1393" /LENGTH=282 /DNA_ID=CAMNT_0016289303 /DNA_START=94 /DNA_END=942 /DNA_ORIENTATION=-
MNSNTYTHGFGGDSSIPYYRYGSATNPYYSSTHHSYGGNYGQRSQHHRQQGQELHGSGSDNVDISTSSFSYSSETHAHTGGSPSNLTSVASSDSHYLDRNNAYSLNMLELLPSSARMMIVLCGIPGSGKSTFSRRLLGGLPPPYRRSWQSLNQDKLKSRKKVISHTTTALKHNGNVIIDRCNFDVTQRAHWVNLAYDFQLDALIAVVMQDYNSTQLCADRAVERGDGDGVHEAGVDWHGVCGRMSAEFQLPSLDEGFSVIYTCRNDSEAQLFIQGMQSIAYR